MSEFFNIDRRVPRSWRLRRAVRRGKVIQFLGLPKGTLVCEILSDVLPNLTRLHLPLGTSDEDYSFLEQAKSLTQLSMWDISAEPIDFTKIPLTSLALDANKNWVSLKRSQTLKKLMIDKGDLSWLPYASPLESLSLHSMGKNRDLTRLSAFPELRKLDLHGNGDLSLEGLAVLSELETVELTSFANVTGLAVLLDLPNLQHVWLEDVKQIDTALPLYELRKYAKVGVIGSKRWHREFREAK